MPKITSIKQQKKHDRVNVYLDDVFGFGIDLDNYVALGLSVGMELSPDEVMGIIKKAEFQKTLDKLLRFAMLRPRSVKEITGWLKRKEVHDSLHPELFRRLKKLELVDDKKFAQWWIGQRLEFKSKSIKEIAFELRGKGIGKEIIGAALKEADINEEKEAKKLLEKKLYRWRSFSPRLARQKMSQYLLRKGFGWEVVKAVVKRPAK